MKKNILSQVTKNMPLGYALHKFIKDENDQPSDYIFEDVNSAFEEYTGLSPDEIVGKKVTEVYPDIINDPFNWIEEYSKVAFEGEQLQFEQFFQPSNKWYKIYAYQSEYGYFITLFEDITEIKKLERQNVILETELEMHQNLTDIYYDKYTNEQAFLIEVLHRALEMSNSQFGYIYLYDEVTSEFKLNSCINDEASGCKVISEEIEYQLEKTGVYKEVVHQKKPIIVNDFSVYNKMKNNSQKHVEILNYMSIPVFEEGNIVAVVGVANKDTIYTILDENQLTLLVQNAWGIKKQKELEVELKKFKTITDNAIYGKVIVDLSDHIIYVNDFFAKVHGYTPNGLVGKPISVFYSQEQLEKVDQLIERMLIKGNFDMQEVWHTHRNGTEFPMLMNGILLKDEKGNPEYMAVSAIDITDLKEKETSLRESEQRFQGIIQSMSDVVYTLDTEKRLTGIFGNWLEESNLTKECFLGKTVTDILGSQQEKIHEDPTNKALSGENVVYQWNMNYGNEKKYYQTTLSPMYDSLGKVSGLVGIGRDITNIKKLEQELNRFKVISDNALYGKAIADLSGHMIYVNKFFAKIHGYTPKELIGKPLSIFHTESQLEEIEPIIDELLENEYIDMQEVWHKHKNDTEFPMLMSGVLLKDENGNAEYMATSAVDITERKQIEEELKEAYHIAKLGRWDYYHDENRLKWSETIFDIFEINSKQFEATYEAFLAAVHPDDRIEVNEIWTESLVNKKPYNIDHRLLMDDGRIKWVHEQCRTEFDEAGYPIHSIGIVQDITKRKEIEHQLFKEKEKLKTTLLSVGDGVISTDPQGKIVILNPITEQLTGWTQDEAIGEPLEVVFDIVNEYTREKCENPVQKVLETGEITDLANHTILISKDGNERIIEDSAAPIKDELGNITGVVLVFRDFTEKKRRQEQIEYLSFHDTLTGLYNRRFFEEEMRRLDTKRSYPLTIIMADLNGLKLTNDAFGHHMGDKLLKQTASLFKTHLRSEDIVARWGGDEFAVLMPNTTSEDAKKVVQRINQGIEKMNENRDSRTMLSIAIGWETKTDSTLDLEYVFKNAEDYMYKKKINESQSAHGLTIKTIINTLFEKSPREKKHSQRVMELAIELAKELNLSQHKIDDIAILGLYHDIGKIAVSSEILEKQGRLTEKEHDEIKKHPAIGYRMLSAINEFSSIADGVLNHHERWDGKGYPRGLKKEEIPLEARIIAVADTYDAMTEKRPYRKNINTIEAIDELEKWSGTKFDPNIVNIFIEKVLFNKII